MQVISSGRSATFMVNLTTTLYDQRPESYASGEEEYIKESALDANERHIANHLILFRSVQKKNIAKNNA